MVTLHETEVDGVRCFWVETGRPTLAARLTFRQGMADEPLRESGWLHLIEHLALHGREQGPLHVNGSVSLLTTAFDSHGPAAQVAGHLSDLTRWLSAPTFDELDRERNVLRAEAELRAGPVTRSLGWRYGARGPGVAAYLEPALEVSTPELLTGRTAHVFTRGNAVLALDGPPPPNLSLDLLEGGLLPAGDAVPCEPTPAAYVEDSGVVVSGVVERGAVATFVPDLLQRALTERLRHQVGGSYAPWATYESVDEGKAVVIAGSDVLPQARGNLAGSMWGLLDQMARNGALDGLLTDAISTRRQSLLDPYAAFGVAVQAAHAVLNGRSPKSFEELTAELDSTAPDKVQRELIAFHKTLLIGLPSETTWTEQWPLVKQPTGAPRIDGRRFRNVNWPATREQLVVGSAGVELRAGEMAQTFAFDQTEAVLAYPDGGRHVVQQDGNAIAVEPAHWTNGSLAVHALDRFTPPSLIIPQGPRHEPPLSNRLSVARRWLPAIRGRVDRVWTRVLAMLAVLGILECGVLYVLWLASNDAGPRDNLENVMGILVLAAIGIPLLMVLVIVAGFQVWREGRSQT